MTPDQAAWCIGIFGPDVAETGVWRGAQMTILRPSILAALRRGAAAPFITTPVDHV